MLKAKNRILAIAIAMFLTLSMSASMILIPSASAHNPAWQIPTHAYIQTLPNPIGVGQSITVYIWLDKTFGSGFEAASYAQVTNDYRFHNYEVVITAPDGTQTTDTFNVITDPTSSQLFSFTPTQVGTYIFNFTFPGQAYAQYPGGYNPASVLVNDTYLASSASTTLTVQQSPIGAATTSEPFPTNYWTRPIYGQDSNWYTLSSNWLGTGNPVFVTENYDKNVYVPDAVGSLTSHIMWTYPLESGGVVGGNLFSTGGAYPASPQGVGYFEGSAYNNRFINPIILDGMLYYKEPVSFGASVGPLVCQNLQTGQIIWTSTVIPALSFGYIYNLWDPDQHGVYPPILFSTNFAQAYDAYTGDPLFNVTGVPTGTAVTGPSGEQLRLVLSNDGTTANPAWYLAEWNSSRLWDTFANPWTGATLLSPALYNDSTASGASLTTAQSQEGNVTQPAIGTPAGLNNNAPATYNYVIYANVVNSSSPLYDYDWNISVLWLNNMGNQTLSTVVNAAGNAQIVEGYSATGSNPDASNPATVIAAYYGQFMLFHNGTLPSGGTPFYTTSWAPYTYFAVDLNVSHTATFGTVLWWNTLQPPSDNVTVLESGVDPVAGVFYETLKETMQYVAYSTTTGQKLWGPTPSQPALDYYGNDFGGDLDGQLAYGNLYSVGFAGVLYCYNEATGNLLWTYGNGGTGNSTYAGFNTFYGDYPTFIQAIGNGVIYTDTTEHTINDPIYKGALTRAINATDGAEIWTLSDWTGGGGTPDSYAIADGYTTFFNGYDDQVYSLGQGPSATTVSAPQTAITAGTNVAIQGTVMDISAGTQQTEQKADFPNGVPCASDASMGAWMGYVYQQQPEPTNFTGVTVTLTAIDPNGNFVSLGTATTDTNGVYHYTWTPPTIPGTYSVTATFAGTNGYWPSKAETTLIVQNAPTVSPTASPISNVATTSDLLTYMAAAVIAIIIAIAIVGLILVRKKP